MSSTGLPSRGRFLGCCLALVSALTLAFSPSASAELSFGPLGSGAGQTDGPEGVAVDWASERVYVADSYNNRIDVFDTTGAFQLAFGWGVADGATKALQTCTTTCFKGIAGSGAGQFNNPAQIAVDNDPASPSFHDVYVTDLSFRVQKFGPSGEFKLAFGSEGKGKCQLSLAQDPIAVGPAGIVYVGDSPGVGPFESEGYINRVQEFGPSGACLEEVELFQGKRPRYGLAVDSSGAIYVIIDGGTDGIRKYDASGTLLYQLTEVANATRLGIDSADNLFAAEEDSGLRVIAEYDEAGNTLRRFGYEAIRRNLLGLAPLSSAFGDVFASEDNRFVEEDGDLLRYLAFPPPGPIVVPSTVKASPLGNTKVTLNAQVNPEGKATTFHFDYVDQAGFEASGFSGAKSSAESASIGSDFRLHLAKAEIGCPKPQDPPQPSCLTPDTTYHFRVIATNADGKAEAEGTFKTQPPLRIEATYATEIGTDAATLHAEVNPLGIPASGRFQYVDEAKYQASGFSEAMEVPSEGQIGFGEGESAVARSASVTLSPGTTYRYRLVAEDPFTTVEGPERILTTFAPLGPGEGGPCANESFRTGPAAFLADCRGYEMASPLEKNNGDILPGVEIATEMPAALNQSSVSGERLTYSALRAFGDALSSPFSAQYVAARYPETGWLTHAIVPSRGAPVLAPDRQLDNEFKAFSPDLCDAWLRTVAEPLLAEGAIERFPNLYRRTDEECSGPRYEALTTQAPGHELSEAEAFFPGQHYGSLELQGLSADGTKVIYAVTDNLTEDAPDQKALGLQLYEQSANQTRFLCILPNGEASKLPCSAGTPAEASGVMRASRVDNALSADGSRVFWSAYSSDPTITTEGKIYLRKNPFGEGPECGEESAPCTIAVSKAAEVLSGTTASRYWSAAEDGSKAIFTSGEDLYVFDVDAEATQLVAHQVRGVMGASEDASRIYFVSKEDLAEGATAGQQNLYLYHEGTFRFIAALGAADVPAGNDLSVVATEPRKRFARVSPDGLHAAFMSFASPTGYDNTDAVNGKAAAEVYLYDAGANGGQGRLLCASCNPTGARPVGASFGVKTDYWAAAHIPVFENTLYAARALSDDGSRLYFASTDTLSPRDTNGHQDVYQWEAQGAGGCGEEDPRFVPSSGGCLSLISSGQSPQGSEFVDASPDGHDVFFSTLSSLVSSDYGLVDIYDARVGGGFPEPANPPAPCEGEACQSPPEAPNDPTPASSSFQGAGNVVEEKPTSCRKPKVRRRGRCVARKHHKRAKHKRASHSGRAGR
jgi:hypothetical protein